MPKLIAAIISWNGLDFLPACLDSCLSANLDEILIIDNHSTDGSLSYVKKKEGQITLIKNDSNRGFTYAANQALEFAINHSFDYLLLLNQDAEFKSDMIPLLENGFIENQKLAILSPVHIKEDHDLEYQFKLNCLQYNIDLTGEGYVIIPFVNAACWMMKIEAVKEIGLFNPLFKNYGSDVNYCHRLINKGYDIAICRNAEVIHKKEDRDYQDSLLKTIKLNNVYHLALILNPGNKVSKSSIVFKLYKGFLVNLLGFNFKKSALSLISATYLLFLSVDLSEK